MTDETPNPGSAEAIEAGCTCGIHAVIEGVTYYCYSLACPIHGETKEDGDESEGPE